MTAGRRRKTKSRKKRIRRIKRKIRMWTARILVLAAVIMVPVLVLQGGLFLWNRITGTEEAFVGAKFINGWDSEKERDPNKVYIVLDAGHGGKDQGTCAGDILEKDINLAVTLKLAEKLKENGAEVLLTRGTDVKIELEDRAKLANEEKADLFVSIHCNYYEKSTEIKGLECYYQETSEGGKELAERISQAFDGIEEVENRGLKTADYRVLRKTDMPAVLIELGYMSNPGECKKLTDERYQELLAERIAAGIL